MLFPYFYIPSYLCRFSVNSIIGAKYIVNCLTVLTEKYVLGITGENMRHALKIAMVDDDNEFLTQLKQFGEQAIAELNLKFAIDTYKNGREFAENYTCNYDIIFLDIEMPEMDGYKVAKKIRETDETVCIIFVTNMAQYAIIGYEVNALDFMIKPFAYFTFLDKLKKAIRYCSTRREREIILEKNSEKVRVKLSRIYYIEKDKNYLSFHTKDGEYRIRGTIAENEEFFCSSNFGKISSGCLVNLRYVTKTNKNTVWVEKEPLPVSRQQQQPFMRQLMRYLGGQD